ncbi:MFS general substrate transporter [Canariomyces notabilis]|uniref:MFS general substrate transporter n=1 Tax=Canariomyces notabilis TaxID=2074819 RepID=A0AAN6T8T3_9PEZI|nr:MFS general substrate transporter [Canariomyces arenarius]
MNNMDALDGKSEQHYQSGQDEPVVASQGAELDPGADWKTRRQEKLIVATMGIIILLVALETDILVPALPTLACELHGTSVETFWVGTAFLLPSATFLPFIGAASEILGRQAMLLVSNTFFTVGTLLCCLANDFSVLLAGRAIQGVGGGGLYTLTTIVITDIVPLRQRPKYLSLISAVFGLGGLLGPLLGGVISERTTWRWLFYINFQFCTLAFAMVPWVIKLGPKRGGSLARNLLRVDWIGGAIFVGGSTSFLIRLTRAGINYPWSSYGTWLPIPLGGIVVILALVYDVFVPHEPFLRLSVYYNASSTIVFFLTLFQGLMFYFQAVKGASTILSGVYLMAVNIVLFPIAVVCGILMTKLGTFTWANRIGFAFMTLANGLFILVDQNMSMVAHLFIFLVVGVAHGFLIGSLNVATQTIAKPSHMTFAVSMRSFNRWFGTCLGVSIGGAIFNNVLLHSLENRGATGAEAQAISQNSEAFVHTLKEMPDGDQKSELTWAYVDGFRGIYYFMVALSGLGLLLSLFIKHHSMDSQEPAPSPHDFDDLQLNAPSRSGASDAKV